MPPRFPPDPALAAVLRELRTRKGQSQEALAHEVGLTVSAYTRIERGTSNPTWSTVSRIADVLGVTLAQLGAAVDEHRSAGS